MSNPLLTVGIPTFNRPKLLRRALESVLSQSFESFEVVISDNASAEDSWQATKALATLDGRVEVRQNSENIGWAGNLNECVKASRGRYVLLLCDDDELLPDMLRTSVDFLEQNPAIGMVHCNGYDCFPDGTERLRKTQDKFVLEAGREATLKILLENNVFFSSMVVRKECYERYGLFTDTCSADWEMWARVGRNHALGHIPRPLVKMHHHKYTPSATVDRYEKDWTFLGNRILSYLPTNDREYYEPMLSREIGKGLISLGKQAWEIGAWRSGQAFYSRALQYVGFSAWAKFYAIDCILAGPRFLAGQKKWREAHLTHV